MHIEYTSGRLGHGFKVMDGFDMVGTWQGYYYTAEGCQIAAERALGFARKAAESAASAAIARAMLPA